MSHTWFKSFKHTSSFLPKRFVFEGEKAETHGEGKEKGSKPEDLDAKREDFKKKKTEARQKVEAYKDDENPTIKQEAAKALLKLNNLDASANLTPDQIQKNLGAVNSILSLFSAEHLEKIKQRDAILEQSKQAIKDGQKGLKTALDAVKKNHPQMKPELLKILDGVVLNGSQKISADIGKIIGPLTGSNWEATAGNLAEYETKINDRIHEVTLQNEIDLDAAIIAYEAQSAERSMAYVKSEAAAARSIVEGSDARNKANILKWLNSSEENAINEIKMLKVPQDSQKVAMVIAGFMDQRHSVIESAKEKKDSSKESNIWDATAKRVGYKPDLVTDSFRSGKGFGIGQLVSAEDKERGYADYVVPGTELGLNTGNVKFHDLNGMFLTTLGPKQHFTILSTQYWETGASSKGNGPTRFVNVLLKPQNVEGYVPALLVNYGGTEMPTKVRRGVSQPGVVVPDNKRNKGDDKIGA